MKKESGKKKWIIIIIVIIAILLILAVVGYFILNKTTGFNFSFSTFDFSGGTGFLDSIGKSGNAFQDTKLNPFANGTG